MPKLVLLRHGQSQWNIAHRFTGWVDVDLTQKGEAEAARAGELIAAEPLALDRVFTSVLTRAIRTALLALTTAKQLWIPMEKDWRLNERHYGGLTGATHEAMAERFGAEQVRIWRRSYDVPPPPLSPGGEHDFARDRRYAGMTPPASESLKLTLERVLPYWREAIAPRLAAEETLLIAAHGNSLRAIVKHLFEVSDADIPGVEIPTGNPLLVELNGEGRALAARYLDAGSATPLPPL
ncbi:MAG TPA: 2,3-diphosphoglycerate-dependent phosphoglycerate mutase [Caulobacteraceae bacterium]|jgi:2,3-bisphosphoglycerate-dependent phosphoglycerate mutase|nr:2,3-diphosphoglycerate-dependent phosphoglycerate mutase [Caulobacteraceae bacterium]